MSIAGTAIARWFDPSGVRGRVDGRQNAPVPAIDVRGLEKSCYGDFGAVRGISFTVDEGEIVAVLGPNGAGKTTMVEILEGYGTGCERPAAVDVLRF